MVPLAVSNPWYIDCFGRKRLGALLTDRVLPAMIKIALLGFGNVGRAFMRHLDKTDDGDGWNLNATRSEEELISRWWQQEEGDNDGEVFAVVHPVRALLAAGVAGTDSLSARLADSDSLPASGHRRRGRSRTGLDIGHVAGAHA
jgi:hypothetical protein